jgi:thioredoxin reductase (NADPH)
MQQMEAQARHVGARISLDVVTKVDLSTRPFRCDTDSGSVLFAEAMVVATGAQAKWLGLQSEQTLRGHGVSSCATCDGFFYRGKTVAVIGGGNTAVEEALYLARHASRVVLIHRRSSLRAEKLLQDRLFTHPRISVIWNSIVADILSGGSPEAVAGLCLSDLGTGMKSILPLDGVFIAIGHSPSTDLFSGQLELDDDGYIQTAPDSTKTSIPGVFAAGDVQDKIFRQAVTAAGSGCMAALEVEKWLRA